MTMGQSLYASRDKDDDTTEEAKFTTNAGQTRDTGSSLGVSYGSGCNDSVLPLPSKET